MVITLYNVKSEHLDEYVLCINEKIQDRRKLTELLKDIWVDSTKTLIGFKEIYYEDERSFERMKDEHLSFDDQLSREYKPEWVMENVVQ